MNEHIHPTMRNALNAHAAPRDDLVVAQLLAEKMAALLYIVGGKEMSDLGYVEFSTHRPWLTRKGCAVFYAAMELIPDANPNNAGEGNG